MTKKKTSIISLAAGLFGLGFLAASLHASQCIDCHNSPKKLIQITREIAKTRPAEKTASKGLG